MHRMPPLLTGLIPFALLLAACGSDDPLAPDAAVDGGTQVDGPPIDGGGPDAPGFYATIPVYINREVDVLFVVDNSGSMTAEQQQLVANFPALINVLQQLPGGLPNLHVGVLSSNVGAAGASSVPGCAAQGDDGNLLTGPLGNTCATQYGLQGTFISDIAQPNGTRLRNYNAGQLEPLFTCMASLGNAGCGFEMHLESLFRALQPGRNPGFFRTDAHLVAIILADEDDCSTELGTMFGDPNAGLTSALGPRTSFRCHEFGVVCDNDPNPRAFGPKTGCRPRDNSQFMFEVTRYVDFLRNLKTGGAEVVVAGILGNFDAVSGDLTVGPDPNNATFPAVQKSCFTNDPNDPDDGASPPVRLSAFFSSFPDRNVTATICNENLQDALVGIGREIKDAVGNTCIEATLADDDPVLPGIQPVCTILDVTDPDGPNRTITPIAACSPSIQSGSTCEPGGTATPCWCLVPEPLACSGNLSLSINRGGALPPLGTVIELYCRAE